MQQATSTRSPARTIPEEQLAAWTAPAFENEDEKRQFTESAIRDAIRGHPLLKTLSISVYAKGSYRNNTNVRRDSDVDVAVEYTGIVFPEYGPDTDQSEVRRVLGIGPYTGPFRDGAGNTQIGFSRMLWATHWWVPLGSRL